MEVEFSARFCQGMVGGVDGCLLHLRPASYCSTTKGIRGIGLFFSFAVLDLVFLRAELEESLHCLLVRRRPLSLDLGGMDQAHNASGHAGHVFSFVALQPSVVPFGWKMIPWAAKGGFGQGLDDDRPFRLLGLDRGARGQFTLGFPWCPLSVTQWERPAILQTLLDRGMERVLFLVFFNLTIASYLHHLLIRRRKRQGGAFSSFCPDFYIGILLFVLMVSPFFLFRTGTLENTSEIRTLKVGICQPFLTDKWQSESVVRHKEILMRQTRFLALTKPDLIVWPEASTLSSTLIHSGSRISFAKQASPCLSVP